jgi:hypothetical protein
MPTPKVEDRVKLPQSLVVLKTGVLLLQEMAAAIPDPHFSDKAATEAFLRWISPSFKRLPRMRCLRF